MWLGEQVLYLLARTLYRTEVAHDQEMKNALASRDTYDSYRHDKLDRILGAARTYGIEIRGKTVLDLGCNDGAITAGYLERGAARVYGLDIDAAMIDKARKRDLAGASFLVSTTERLPLSDAAVDVIISYDTFEHISRPAAILGECRRVLKPGGKLLLGTWGWRHPFAHHLWSILPVPWAHVFFSERTIMRVCRRIYHSAWYKPNMHDFDGQGQRIQDRYLQDSISTDYLNKLLVRDFERVFQQTGLQVHIYPQSFGSRWARWTRIFLRTPWLREFVTAYFWAVLEKPAAEHLTLPRPIR